MPLKALALALPLLVVHSTSLAQELEKNGLPCVAEVCLGDSVNDLSKIQWAPAQQSYKLNNKPVLIAARKLSDDEARLIQAGYPNAGEAAPYFLERQFDATSLPLLARVGAACEANELFGSYGSSGSMPTKVGISLMPTKADPAKQAWVVTTIIREFPSAQSNDDRAALVGQLVQRYHRFGAGNRVIQSNKPFEGRFMPSGSSRFGFGLSMVRPTGEAVLMKQHPACATGDK